MKISQVEKWQVFLENGVNNLFFWEEVWKEARKQSISSRRLPQVDALAYWSAQANKFGRWLGQEHTKKYVEKVFSWLAQHDIFWPEMEVLDIGAGAGAFTIPFAGRAKRVAALEPVPSLRALLAEKVIEAGLNNVEIIESTWEETDPREDGFAGRFGLVFASFVPAIKNSEAINKMIACSQKWCFISDFAGFRHTAARQDLWKTFFGEDMPSPGNDIIFPLLYLYFSGYSPFFTVWKDERVEDLCAQEAVNELKNFFSNYLEITPKVNKVICDYVTQMTADGIFHDKYQARRGMLLWSIA